MVPGFRILCHDGMRIVAFEALWFLFDSVCISLCTKNGGLHAAIGKVNSSLQIRSMAALVKFLSRKFPRNQHTGVANIYAVGDVAGGNLATIGQARRHRKTLPAKSPETPDPEP